MGRDHEGWKRQAAGNSRREDYFSRLRANSGRPLDLPANSRQPRNDCRRVTTFRGGVSKMTIEFSNPDLRKVAMAAARTVLDNPADIEDAVQDCFLQLLVTNTPW